MNITKRHVLVFGGAGFIGSHFIKRLLRQKNDIEIVNFDLLTYAGNPANLTEIQGNASYRFVRGDIVDSAAVNRVFRDANPEFVINFAAETHVDRSIHEGAKRFLETNMLGVYNVLENLKNNSEVKQFLQVSTDEVYGDLPLESNEQFTPDSPVRPNSPYAASKAQGDLLCRAYFKTYNTPVVVTRCGNNYGPNQYPEKLIPFLILRALKGKTLPLYGDGLYVRDWIHVEDHADALISALFEGKAGAVYTIGSKTPRHNIEIAKSILKYFNQPESRIEFVTDRPGHDRKYHIDPSRIEQELGFKPKREFDKGLQETIEWYVKNPEWIQGVRKRDASINSHIAS